MKKKGVKTAVSNRGKCIQCGEPIIKGEGIIIVSGYIKSSYKSKAMICYKCSKEGLKVSLKIVKYQIEQLDNKCKLTMAELKERKLAKII